MMILRGLIAFALLTVPAFAALERFDYVQMAKGQRGEIRRFIDKEVIECGRKRRYRNTEFISDGDRWIRRESGAGLKLYIEIEHEQNPDALE